jgi:hypothetical protein
MDPGSRRESLHVPWDVLVNKLDRYLRLGYASAVLAGFVLASEVAVLTIAGSPAERRAKIASAATSVSKWDLSTLVLLVAVAAALIAAYLVGVTARVLTFAVVGALAGAVTLFRIEALRW